MPVEQLVKQIEESGILAGDTLQQFIPPQASPKDAEELARELIRQRKLTKFQAEVIWLGKGKSLVLGNYVLLEKIGQGGMGAVYKAEHRRMKRTVAIKMLPTKMMKDAAAAARFQREVEAAARLRHTNIVAADDADEANGVHFLVMEYVEGSDLSALVKKNGPLPFAKAVNCILQAARGLEFAHGEGVIHRDIKPANLLLDKKGTVKILDMGLARIDSQDGDAATQAELTGTGAVMGTVDYMAPEQALSTKNADARADIYSLGCSLFYLLTGKATYQGDSLMAKLLAHRETAIPSLREVQSEVPEHIEAVFRKMVAKKVEDRYQSMTEVIAALESCGSQTEQSINTEQLTASASNTGFSSFLENISATTPVTLPTRIAPVKRPTPADGAATAKPRRNNKTGLLIGAAVLGVLLLAGVIISLQTKDGTLIVEIDQPDAVVQVLDAEGKLEISQKGGKGKITIGVDPGKHRLKVEKSGFTVFGQDFEIESGGKKTIAAKLVPATAVVGQPEKPWNTPAFQQWMKDVGALPAEEQVEAVSRKLMELNPGFDGTLKGYNGLGPPDLQNGMVGTVSLRPDNIRDISALRAFEMLAVLRMGANAPGKSRFADLSPLEGMALSHLIVENTLVADLSPLQSCKKLATLNIKNTRVAPAQVAALQMALPNCKIEWDDPAKSQAPTTAPVESRRDPAPATTAPDTTTDNVPPPGFMALFNGKDLTGWQGVVPINTRSRLSAADLEKTQTAANDKVLPHWTVRDGVLHYDGRGDSLQTTEDFGDFELYVDWKISPKGDGGIYLRGSPQVQMWESSVGSGGLYNNKLNPSAPLQAADKPPGEWNTFHIIMVEDKVTVSLNGVLVVDQVTMENYWDRSMPIPATGPIELQHHTSLLEFKNIFLKKL